MILGVLCANVGTKCEDTEGAQICFIVQYGLLKLLFAQINLRFHKLLWGQYPLNTNERMKPA